MYVRTYVCLYVCMYEMYTYVCMLSIYLDQVQEDFKYMYAYIVYMCVGILGGWQ